MSKINMKGGALLAPLPVVLVTSCGTDRDGKEKVCGVMTAAWTGIVNTVPPKTYIAVRKSRYSHSLIASSGEFVLNVPSSDLVRKVDYCGIYTGAKEDKFGACSFHTEKAECVSAPRIAECPLCLECRVTDVRETGSHDVFTADIVNVAIDEKLMDEKGKIRLDKAHLMAFAHGDYFALGKKIGDFGFSARKRRTSRSFDAAEKEKEKKKKKNEQKKDASEKDELKQKSYKKDTVKKDEIASGRDFAADLLAGAEKDAERMFLEETSGFSEKKAAWQKNRADSGKKFTGTAEKKSYGEKKASGTRRTGYASGKSGKGAYGYGDRKPGKKK